MNQAAMLQKVKKRLPDNRYGHVIGVIAAATVLAKKFGVSEEKAKIAAILHDVAKFSDREWMKSIIEQQNMDPRLLEAHTELWHAPVGAYVAQKEFGITDEEILDAIRYHTTGRAGMSDLEKVIYIADMVEPNRKFNGVEQLRSKKEEGLDEMMHACINHSIAFLQSKKQPVFPDSLACAAEYEKQKGRVEE